MQKRQIVYTIERPQCQGMTIRGNQCFNTVSKNNPESGLCMTHLNYINRRKKTGNHIKIQENAQGEDSIAIESKLKLQIENIKELFIEYTDSIDWAYIYDDASDFYQKIAIYYVLYCLIHSLTYFI